MASAALAAGALAGVACAQGEAASGGVPDGEALAIVHKHCLSCHAAKPAHEAFATPPRDVALETLTDLRRHAEAVYRQTILDRAMPLGNAAGMTEAERARLGDWLRAVQ